VTFERTRYHPQPNQYEAGTRTDQVARFIVVVQRLAQCRQSGTHGIG
jgi:hypothetical protein